MFNVSDDNAAKYQKYLLRLMGKFERSMVQRVYPVIQSTYEEASKLVEHGQTDFSIVIEKHRQAMQKQLQKEYDNLLAYFGTFTFDQFKKAYQKRIVVPKTKSMEDIYWQNIKQWSQMSVLYKSREISKTTNKLIQSLIRNGMQNGLSNAEIVDELMDKRKTFNKVRAIRIVRTETHSAANKAIDEAVRSTGYTHDRIWRATLDDRVRGANPKDRFNHLKANGQKRDLNTPFDVSGDKLNFPGDPKGRAGNVVNCIVSPKAPIFTSKGWKQINKIIPGDMVLTHKNRFRKVLRLSRSRYSGEIIIIKTVLKGVANVGRVAVTPEHPFLIGDKWIQAKDLKVGDKVQMMASFCAYCGKPIPWWLKFCNISCSSKKLTERQWSDPKHRERVSETQSALIKRQYADGARDRYKQTKKALKSSKKKYGAHGFFAWVKENNSDKYDQIRRKMVSAVEDKYGSYAEMISQKAYPALCRIAKNGGTKIEIAMEKFLKKNRKKFIPQFVVGRRRIDFYVPKDKMFIECDGYPWHKDKERERKRDYEILMKYPDHTIAHVDYKPNPPSWDKWTLVDLMQLNHDGIYSQIAMPIVAIEKSIAKQGNGLNKTVYNFAVEDDESYIVNGLESHNCRCVLSYSTKRIRT